MFSTLPWIGGGRVFLLFGFCLKIFSRFAKKHKTFLVVHTWKLVELLFLSFVFYLLVTRKRGKNWIVPKIFFNVDRLVEVCEKSLLLFSPLSSWTKMGKHLCKHTPQTSAAVWVWPATLSLSMQKYSTWLKTHQRYLTHSYSHESTARSAIQWFFPHYCHTCNFVIVILIMMRLIISQSSPVS